MSFAQFRKMDLFTGARDISFSDNSRIIFQNYGTIVQNKYAGKRGLENPEEIDAELRDKRLRLRSFLEDFEEHKQGDMFIKRTIADTTDHGILHIGRRRAGTRQCGKVQVVTLASRKVSEQEKFLAISYEGRDADRVGSQ
ncbi:hypothetical protein D9758_008123 [Tetrapyrgos nigripes]|uniref:Uncharacterized protein n=1 Tax=Tetrapyrgos nigripes TaxID=182062 RepID=A0A8H5GHJ2_9AGAR|nr:hypothetical protein D9758_008123 [Tetrapyrgos nigripes]